MSEDELPRETPPAWKAFTPEDSPLTPEDILGDPEVRDLSTAKLAVGDAAYDFQLPIWDFSDGVGAETAETFALRERAEARPVALVFGSYT